MQSRLYMQCIGKAMTIKSIFFVLMPFVCFLLLSFHTADETHLMLKLNNIRKKGKVFVSVCYDASQWPDKGKHSLVFSEVKNGVNYFAIKNIPFGQVSLAIFLDTNDNGKLDTNIFGAPSEPYAFSNNVMPRFSAPSFNECSFMYLKTGQEVSVSFK